jgi:[acyl-carrier-protein] S-malonyltransferase
MKPAADKMAAYLKNITINGLHTPVFNNVKAEIETDAETVYNSLVQQVSSPVLWTKSVENMASSGVSAIIEVGAGKVLTGLVKKINKEIELKNIGVLGDEDGL